MHGRSIDEFKDVHDMIQKEMKKGFGKSVTSEQSFSQQFSPLHQIDSSQQNNEPQYTYEEQLMGEFGCGDVNESKGSNRTAVYHGFDSSKLEAKGSQNSTNAIDRSHYALMTFDKKREAFRMVPIQSHLLFEKKKQVLEKKEISFQADFLSEST